MTAKTTTKKTGIVAWLEHWPIVVVTGAIGLFAMGCKLVSGTEAPTSVERAFYDTQTNYVLEAKVVLSTNIVNETNTVQVLATNTVGQIVVAQQTNIVPQYVVVPLTNYVNQPVYTLTQNANAATAAQTVTLIGNSIVPGAGTLAGSALTALLGIWGWARSYKKGNLAQQSNATLVQEIETMLEFVNTLPNGTAYVSTLQSWLQSHQVDTGTAATILTAIEGSVSNPDAKVAVQDILSTLTTLGTPLPSTLGTPVPIAAAPAAAAKT